jgi:hypothetical protein
MTPYGGAINHQEIDCKCLRRLDWQGVKVNDDVVLT